MDSTISTRRYSVATDFSSSFIKGIRLQGLVSENADGTENSSIPVWPLNPGCWATSGDLSWDLLIAALPVPR